jgi:hypothetical protein
MESCYHEYPTVIHKHKRKIKTQTCVQVSCTIIILSMMRTRSSLEHNSLQNSNVQLDISPEGDSSEGKVLCCIERLDELAKAAADAQSSEQKGTENAGNSTRVRGRWRGGGAAAASGVARRPQGFYLPDPESENDGFPCAACVTMNLKSN